MDGPDAVDVILDLLTWVVVTWAVLARRLDRNLRRPRPPLDQ